MLAPSKNNVHFHRKPKKRLPSNPLQIFYLKLGRRRIKYKRYIYLVSHAEKENPNDANSALSQKGFEKANDLRDYFSNIPLQLINVSNFISTQQTAEPTAIAKGLRARQFDQQTQTTDGLNVMLVEFGALSTGNILVVGHTNSIPYLIKAFCDIDINPIAEDDYDNLFRIAISENGAKYFFITTYGQTSP
jgi:phosphohistidine phosphatase SixA